MVVISVPVVVVVVVTWAGCGAGSAHLLRGGAAASQSAGPHTQHSGWAPPASLHGGGGRGGVVLRDDLKQKHEIHHQWTRTCQRDQDLTLIRPRTLKWNKQTNLGYHVVTLPPWPRRGAPSLGVLQGKVATLVIVVDVSLMMLLVLLL